MNTFVVSLFGHREINNLRESGNRLYEIIKELAKSKPYISFLIGRNGDFDEYAASVIKQMQHEIGKENSDMTLVLPYTVSSIKYYEEYYDRIIIPDKVHGVHPNSAITLKNRWMIEHSDLVIVHVERSNGGAYTAMKYAEKLNKSIINLYKSEATY